MILITILANGLHLLLANSLSLDLFKTAMPAAALSIPTRVMAASQDIDMDTGDAVGSATKFVADPSKLVKKKKVRYYCVRKGWVPGIYYTPEEADAQLQGYKGHQMTALKQAEEAEELMNHAPEACRFAACRKSCQEEAEEALLRDRVVATTTATCELCAETIPAGSRGVSQRHYPEEWLE